MHFGYQNLKLNIFINKIKLTSLMAKCLSGDDDDGEGENER